MVASPLDQFVLEGQPWIAHQLIIFFLFGLAADDVEWFLLVFIDSESLKSRPFIDRVRFVTPRAI